MPEDWTPAALAPSLIAAWNPQDPTTVVPGPQLHLTGAWGTTRDLIGAAAGAPLLTADFGPGHQTCISFARAASQRATFADLPSGDLHIFIVVDFTSTAGDQAILGRQAQGTAFIKLVSNSAGFQNLSVRPDGAASATTIPLPYRKAAGRFEVLELAYDSAAGALTVTQNDRTSGAVPVGPGGFPCNQLGGANGAGFIDAHVGAVAIYDRLLTPAETADQRSFFDAWRSACFFISAAGVDTARGDRADRPWASLAKVEGLSFKCRPGDTYVLEAGAEIRRTGKFAAPVSGAAAAPIVLKGADPLNKTKIYGSRRFAGGWTHNPDGTWSRSDVGAPLMVWVTRPGGMATPIVKRPLTTPNSFSFASPTLTVALADGEDLNACEVEIAGTATYSFYQGSRAFWTFENLRIFHMPLDAFSPQGAAGITARNVEMLYCANDGWGPGGGTGLLLEDFLIRGSGQRKTDNSAPGDGISHHGTAQGVVRRGRIEFCMKAGIDDERGANIVYEDVTVHCCNHNYRWLNQPAVGSPSGTQVLTRVTIERGADDFAHGVEVENGLAPANYSFTATDCVIKSIDPGPRRGSGLQLSSGTAAINTSVSDGFLNGLTGGATVTANTLTVL